MIRNLPHWCLTDIHPAFNDTESLSVLEQTSRLYGKMQELVTNYNKFVDDINACIKEYKESIDKDYEEFTCKITKIIHDYIKMIDEKIKLQDVTINDSIIYIKENLETSIKSTLEQMSDSGELDEIILSSLSSVEASIESMNNELSTMKDTYDNKINNIENNISVNTNSIKNLETKVINLESKNVITNYDSITESLTITIGGES